MNWLKLINSDNYITGDVTNGNIKFMTLNQKNVYDVIANNPKVNQMDIASILNIVKRTVVRICKLLQENGYIERINGNQRDGYWKILKKQK